MLLQFCVDLQLDALGSTPVLDVNLFHHRLEERLLRLWRRRFEHLLEPGECLPDVLERDGVGGVVR